MICSGQALIGDPWGQNQILLQQDTTTNSACITGFQEGTGAVALQVGLTGFPANLYLLNGSLVVGSSTSAVVDNSGNVYCKTLNNLANNKVYIDSSGNSSLNSMLLSSGTGSTYGIMIINSTASTTISAINTWYQIAGSTTTPVGMGLNCTVGSSNKITINATQTQLYKIEYHVGVNMTAGTLDNVGIIVYKNGAGYSYSQMTASLAVNQVANINGSCILSLATNDYIQLYIQNQTATNNLTVLYMQVIITPIGF